MGQSVKSTLDYTENIQFCFVMDMVLVHRAKKYIIFHITTCHESHIRDKTLKFFIILKFVIYQSINQSINQICRFNGSQLLKKYVLNFLNYIPIV